MKTRSADNLPAALISDWQRRISSFSGHPANPCAIEQRSVASLVLRAGDASWFIKFAASYEWPRFEAEADGLAALRSCDSLHVPRVVGFGTLGAQAFLISEYLHLNPIAGNAKQLASAGRALVDLHRMHGAAHGWPQDNFIGATPQTNRPLADWAEFFRSQRLLPQLELARKNSLGSKLQDSGERLLDAVPALLAGHIPVASLLHGDLWGGNAALDEEGRLALYDPAVHYGDRETDLAMMDLFGGFPPDFLAAYAEAWPLEAGHAMRRTLYQLFHVLNHANLFGGSYAGQALRMMETLLAEVHG